MRNYEVVEYVKGADQSFNLLDRKSMSTCEKKLDIKNNHIYCILSSRNGFKLAQKIMPSTVNHCQFKDRTVIYQFLFVICQLPPYKIKGIIVIHSFRKYLVTINFNQSIKFRSGISGRNAMHFAVVKMPYFYEHGHVMVCYIMIH